MADPKKEKQKNIKPVCSLSVPTIIMALHKNALKKASIPSDCQLINSAVDNDGKEELKSAGEHVISIIPSDGKKVKKSEAVKAIKDYVQWFVGPDLSNKVDDKTVKPLSEIGEGQIANAIHGKEGEASDDTPSETESGDDEDVPNEEEMNESFKLSFNQYLLLESNENDDDDDTGSGDDGADSTGEGDDDMDETGEGDDDIDDTGAGEDDADDTGEGADDDDKTGEGKETPPDESEESAIGYAIAYNLKIEGLKQTALKDALKKFAATFFDDLTITADGLFGGGKSFTVGDVKKAIKDVFGNVDANQLKNDISKTLSKKYDGVDTSILSKEKIFRKYKQFLDVKQKQPIDKADYSVVIRVPATVKKELNPRIMADTVTSSIKGLFKKFKHQIKKDDIIYLRDVEDGKPADEKTKDISKLFIEPKELISKIRECDNIKAGWKVISDIFSKIKDNKTFETTEYAKKLYDKYRDIKNKDNKANDDGVTKNADGKTVENKLTSDEMEKHFKSMIDAYTETYNANLAKKDKKELSETDDLIFNIISESIRRRFDSNIDRIKQHNSLKNEIMDILFVDNNSLLEDDESDIDFGDEGDDGDSSDDSSEKGDLYIIPMPGLEYKGDDE